MCQSAVMWAGIGLVVYGTAAPYMTGIGCPQADIRAEEIALRTPFASCEIVGGVLGAECNTLFDAAFVRPPS